MDEFTGRDIFTFVTAPTGRPSPELAKALAILPRNVEWEGGRPDLPWGLGNLVRGRVGRPAVDIDTVLMGRSSWFFRTDSGDSYGSLREAFVGNRLNRDGETCGCVRLPGVPYSMAVVDFDNQLELMREVLRRIILEMPNIDLSLLTHDLFLGDATFAGHYLWWLEREMFIAHPTGEERQDRLMLTDEGFAVLVMLEMTKPGSNYDLSPEAVHRLRIERGPLPETCGDVPFRHTS